MLNSDPPPGDATSEDAEITSLLPPGATGAAVLAGIATAIVVAIWFAFWLLVFVPRAGAP
jgi:hypothetical protein